MPHGSPARFEKRLPADMVSAAFDGSTSDQIHIPSEYGEARLDGMLPQPLQEMAALGRGQADD